MNWDDGDYVLANTPIQRIDGQLLLWAVSTRHTGNWIPLTWLSHAVDWWVGGDDPRVHHATSILLHCMSAGLVVWISTQVLRLMGRTGTADPGSGQQQLAAAMLSGLLFGIHPLRVESVSWISERKDVLSGALFLGSVGTYLGYAGNTERPRWMLFTSWLLFVLGFLAKSMVMTLPLDLLVIDVAVLRRWPRERMRSILEKLPFLCVTVVLGVVALHSQTVGGAVSSIDLRPIDFRILHAFRTSLFYLGKMLFPIGLSPFYPLPSSARFTLEPVDWLSPVVVAGLTLAFLLLAKRGRWECLSAWAWYLITVAPVLGIVPIGSQAYADRYTYLPSVGLTILAAVGCTALGFRAARSSRRLAVVAGIAAAALLMAFASASVERIHVWHDSVTLWERVVALAPDVSSVPHGNLANAYFERGELDGALREAKRAIALFPEGGSAHNVVGAVHLVRGETEAAEAAFRLALRCDPSNDLFWFNLAAAQRAEGRPDQALESLRRGTEVAPGSALAWLRLADVLLEQGDRAGSVYALDRVVRCDPRLADQMRERIARAQAGTR